MPCVSMLLDNYARQQKRGCGPLEKLRDKRKYVDCALREALRAERNKTSLEHLI